MEPSTLVLSALLQLHVDMHGNDAFCGYEGDAAAQTELLAELWEAYYAAPSAPETAEALIVAWYEITFPEEEV